MRNYYGENYTPDQQELLNQSFLQALQIELESIKEKYKNVMNYFEQERISKRINEIKADINRIMWKK